MPLALVTGANRGIGLALVSRLGARAPVIGTTRNGNAAPNVHGVRWETLSVSDPRSHVNLAKRLSGTPVSLLICNAGIYHDKGHNLDHGFPASLWEETFATNVTGVFLSIQSLMPNLLAAKDARIAVISSQMASSERAPGGSYIYRASKAAALNLGRNLAADLAPRGIAVGIYHPGWVRTDMGGSAADISVEEAADGLMDRFDALSMKTTGCFETWDGRTHPY